MGKDHSIHVSSKPEAESEELPHAPAGDPTPVPQPLQQPRSIENQSDSLPPTVSAGVAANEMTAEEEEEERALKALSERAGMR